MELSKNEKKVAIARKMKMKVENLSKVTPVDLNLLLAAWERFVSITMVVFVPKMVQLRLKIARKPNSFVSHVSLTAGVGL